MDCSQDLMAQPTTSPPGITKKAARLTRPPRWPRIHPKRNLKRRMESLHQELAAEKAQKRAAKVVGIKRLAAPALPGEVGRNLRRCYRLMLLTICRCSIRVQFFNYSSNS